MRAFFVSAPLILALTGCLSDLPPTDRLGFVTVRNADNGGTPVVRGSAVFYRTSGLRIIPIAPAACGMFSYAPPTSGDNAGRTLNAGPQVSFTVGGFSENAVGAVGAVYPVYNFPVGSYLDFVAGDSVLVNIPGALDGFEPMSIKVRLAEPFEPDPLPAYVPNTDWNVTWDAAPAPGSIMIVSLRYNQQPGSTVPNIEISCAFPDNGSATIPSLYVNGYGTSEPASREFAFTRVRERIVEFDDRTRTRVRSLYEVPTVPLNDSP